MENHRYHDGLRAALQLAPVAAHSDPAAHVDDVQRARLAAAYAGKHEMHWCVDEH